MSNIILTGDRPTGKLHIGHYVGSIKRRLELQEKGDYDKFYIMIADAQALTDNFANPTKVREHVIEVALDYLACGLDPKKITFLIQSQIPGLTELTFYYMNLVTLARLERNPTIKEELKLREFQGSIPTGFLTYPISQAADITGFRGTIVPVGDDQLPMVEQTREIVRSFNNIYGDILVEPNVLLPDNKVCNRLPGTDGKAKMSKSIGNCIYLSDDEKTLKEKVMSMYTDPNHIRIEDPGQVEGNTVFTYLDAFVKESDFTEFLPEYKNLDELKDHYRQGGLGDVKIKKFLFEVLNRELSPIRARRKEWESKIEEVYEILKQGTMEANQECNKTVEMVKNAMGINYFTDESFLQSQKQKYNCEN